MKGKSEIRLWNYLSFLSVGILLIPSLWTYETWHASRKYDGEWWSSASPGQRQGFLEGYFDCLKFEAKKGFQGMELGSDMRLRIEEYFDEHPDSLARLVVDVWRELSRNSHLRRRKIEGGEKWKEPHIWYDGFFWQNQSEPFRLGFIEGYLLCYQRDARNPRGTFSKRPIEYVRKISDWYRLDRESGQADSERQPVKIPEVLYMFVDTPANSK